MHPFLKLIGTFSTDNHARGVQFEKLCQWLLETHPLYKSKLTQVWLWDNQPRRWGTDCSIDLVAQETKGNNQLIQTKCYDFQYSATKQDIASWVNPRT